MKKILTALIYLSLLTVLVAPMVVLAQPPAQCTLKHAVTDIDPACTKGATVSETVTKAWGMCCLLDAVYTATDWIFIVLIVLVGLLIIWGGVDIATASGVPEKVAGGRNKIIYALIGLAVALLSKALPSVVKALLGV